MQLLSFKLPRPIALGVMIGVIASSFGYADEWQDGCYTRVYSVEHMRANPEQEVSAMRVQLKGYSGEYEWLSLHAVLTDQTMAEDISGRQLSAHGETFSSEMSCYIPTAFSYEWQRPGRYICVIDCDGGFVEISHDSDDVLRVRTTYVRLESSTLHREGIGACGGESTTSLIGSEGESTAPVTFLLYRTHPRACES